MQAKLNHSDGICKIWELSITVEKEKIEEEVGLSKRKKVAGLVWVYKRLRKMYFVFKFL